jgi:predicted porin
VDQLTQKKMERDNMKTIFLCAATATVLLGTQLALAQSNVTVTGVLDSYAGSRQLSGSPRSTRIDSSGLTTSQLVLQGVEDLGGGLKAEFVLGMFLRVDTGESGRFTGDPLFARNSYVGLSGGLGTLRLGRQTTGNFLNFIRTNSFGDSPTFGPTFVQTWVAAVAQGSQFMTPGAPPTSRSLTGALGTTDSTWNNAIGYISPNLGGVTVTAQWAPSEAAGVGNRAGLSAFYANGPLILALATEQIGNASVPPSGPAAAVLAKQRTWHASGAYAFPFGRISAGYLDTKRDYAAIVDDSVRTWHLGANIPVGAGSVLFQTAHSRQTLDTGAATTRTTTSVGYDYNLSKRTDLYAVVMNDRFTGNASGNSYGVGIRHRF